MTTASIPTDPTYANCRGVNHSDSGPIGTCDGCGAEVVRAPRGIFPVERVGTYGARKYSCYHGRHVCDPAMAAACAASMAGTIVKGSTVVVVRGRKVPRGTVGIVRWIGEDNYGKGRVGLAVEGCAGLTYTATSNVELSA